MPRNPSVAGAFYPSEPELLKKEVSSFLGKAGSGAATGQILGFIVPHAGYAYSGAVAGIGFNAVRDVDFKTLIIIGTGHRYASDKAAVYGGGSFLTPLGEVRVDEQITAELMKNPKFFEKSSAAHEGEHSIEVQLPFLQMIKREKVKIVPILISTVDTAVLGEIGRILAETAKKNFALICVSSDLSHYPPAELARRADNSILLALQTAVRIKDISYFRLANRLILEKGGENLSCVCCGEGAVMAGAAACLESGADDFQILKYVNSGEISGDTSQSVGYAAGIFIKTGAVSGKTVSLSPENRKHLLALARKSIENFPAKRRHMELELSDEPALNLPGAVFVTLHKNKRLRGCIGTMEPRSILQDAVAQFACAAAFDDTRFDPVTVDELKTVKIEISVLSPLEKIPSAELIEPGRHGVYIRKGGRSGTYLPQVWEHFSSKDDFLNSLCAEKTGLNADDWKKSSTELYRYTVECFEE